MTVSLPPGRDAEPADPATAIVTRWVLVRPVGTMSIRDGRDQALGGVLAGLSPMPSTVAGAIAAASTAPEPGAAVLTAAGPLLWRDRPRPEMFFPVPADVVTSWRSAPRTLTRPGLTGQGEPPKGVWSASQLAGYLAGGTGPYTPATPTPETLEPRIGLAREGRTARAGMLYQARHLRLAEEWAYAVRCELRAGHAVRPGLVRFGGQTQYAELDVHEPDPGFALPALPPDFPDGRVLVYLSTPALLSAGTEWCPPGAELRGVACAGPQPIASASRGRRSTARLDWAVPAGTVFFLTFTTEQKADEWARTQHQRCLPEQFRPLAQTAGFGLALVGRW